VTILTSGPVVSPSDPGLQIVSYIPKARLSFGKVKEFDRFCSDYLSSRQDAIVLGLDRNRFQTHLRASNGVHAAYLQHRKAIDPLFKRLSHAINPLHRQILSLEKKGFEHPELRKLFTNSEMVRQEILEYYNVDPQKIQVVHNGVEWSEMQNDFDATCAEREKHPSPFHFLFVGHNYQRKGLEPLLAGLSLIKDTDFQLSVVGKEKNLAPFHMLIKKFKLERKVSFFGNQSRLTPFFQQADALVIPSWYDPFANVTVEALAMGLFVVSSKSNGAHEILNPTCGTLVDSLSDPECMAAALRIALAHPKTPTRAAQIRHSVAHLDFSQQLLPLITL
jgi:UDP-glucose:(heptosyl)LPS alpha-1,3-glucosyltransferase